MTPAARLSASIEILDLILNGQPVEKVLTNWARRNRYAGSGDRASIRDLVFDIIRKRRSCGAMGGSETGRGLVIGHLRQSGDSPEQYFGEGKYAPAPLTEEEQQIDVSLSSLQEAVRLDYPEWIEADLKNSLGDDFKDVMANLRERAPVFLRVNTRKTTVPEAIKSLAEEEIEARPHPLATAALEVLKNSRRVSASTAFQGGFVELQDAASQAIMESLCLPETGKILDYCAGGGGKALAIAARSNAAVHAFDVIPARMGDIPTRAERAGVCISIVSESDLSGIAPFDLVLCDVPCSGSGAWRRAPAGKWDLSADKLNGLLAVQLEILKKAACLVRPGGVLAYSTCSILTSENLDQVHRFAEGSQDFDFVKHVNYKPLNGGDGLFAAILKRV